MEKENENQINDDDMPRGKKATRIFSYSPAAEFPAQRRIAPVSTQ